MIMGAQKELNYCPACGNELTSKDTFCDLCGVAFSEKKLQKQIKKQAEPKTPSKIATKIRTRLKKVNKVLLTIAIISFLYGIVMVILIPIIYYGDLSYLFPIFMAGNILGLILSIVSFQPVRIVGILGILSNLVAFLIEIVFGILAFVNFIL